MSTMDYIPRSDAEFNIWQDNFVLKITPMPQFKASEVPSSALEKLTEGQSRWVSAFRTAQDPATRTKAAVQEKNDARKAYEADMRSFIKAHYTYNPDISDAERLSMGLPVHDKTHTAATAPTTRPEVEIDLSQQLQHTLRVKDSASKSSAKPAGVGGFEIWRKVGGDTVPGVEELLLVAQASRSPHTLKYTSDNRGKPVYYMLRWVSTRGETGPWSEIASATIA